MTMEIKKYTTFKDYPVYASGDTPIRNKFRIEPVYSGESTCVTQYKIIDYIGNVWFIGTKEECEQLLNKII